MVSHSQQIGVVAVAALPTIVLKSLECRMPSVESFKKTSLYATVIYILLMCSHVCQKRLLALSRVPVLSAHMHQRGT